MPEKQEIFVRRASGLVRELSWFDVLIWSMAGPAASGMTYYAVKMLGDPTAYGGNEVLAFFLAGLMFLPVVIAAMAIASSFPRSSSLYVFVSRVVHPILGYIPFWYYIVMSLTLSAGFLMVLGIKAMAGAIAVAAIGSSNSHLLGIAKTLTDPMTGFYISVLMIVVLWIFNYFGVKTIKWSMRIITIIPLAITIFVLGGMLFKGPDAAMHGFNQIFGAGAAQQVMNAAFKGGNYGGTTIDPLVSLSVGVGTYGMLLWTLWAWSAVEGVTFVGSEVKNPGKSYIKGYIAGWIAVMILYVANAAIVPWSGNYDFLAAYSYLASNYPDVLTNMFPAFQGMYPPAGSVPFVAALIWPTPAVAILIGIAYFLWYFNTSAVLWVGAVRGFFSLAFDRLLPQKMTEVSPRWAAPTWANHVTAIMAFLGALLGLMDSMGSNLATGALAVLDFGSLIFIWPVGLGMLMVPWWKPELYKRMTIQSKALLATVGVIMFILGWWMMLLTAYYDMTIQIINATIGGIGIIIFVLMVAHNKKKGIPVDKVFSEIPPA